MTASHPVRGAMLLGGVLALGGEFAFVVFAEAMKAVGEVNAYVSRTEPFKLKGDDQRERLATVLHTLTQCVSDLNTILAPFLPHAANRVHTVLGGEGASSHMAAESASSMRASFDAIEAATGRVAQKNMLPMQPGDVPATWADATLIEALTGALPRTDIGVGVQRFVDWYRDYYGV